MKPQQNIETYGKWSPHENSPHRRPKYEVLGRSGVKADRVQPNALMIKINLSVTVFKESIHKT